MASPRASPLYETVGPVITLNRDNLFFVNKRPDWKKIECSACRQVLLDETHYVNCCSRYFCDACLCKLKASNAACPLCKAESYESFIDKDRLRIINGLQIYCINKKSGCRWKGELKDLLAHINRGKRDGDCQFEVVQCCYQTNSIVECDMKAPRCHLLKHETEKCLGRPYKCQYCKYGGSYRSVTQHYKSCSRYPVSCTNGCGQTQARDFLKTHCDRECPLQPVECEFNWAGCSEKVLRRDLTQHASDQSVKHTTLLAKACKELLEKNSALKSKNENLKRRSEESERKYAELKAEFDRREAERCSIM